VFGRACTQLCLHRTAAPTHRKGSGRRHTVIEVRTARACLRGEDEAVQTPSRGGVAQSSAGVHGEGRDPAGDHLAREVLPLVNA
jgi:hypothetical protein